MMEFGQKKFVLNRAYRLKNDKRRIMICNNYSQYYDPYITDDSISKDLMQPLHPYLAYIISLFDGKKNVDDIYECLNQLLDVPILQFYKIIHRLTENNEIVSFSIPNIGTTHLPKRLLTEVRGGYERLDLHISEKEIVEMTENIDLASKRLYHPDGMMLMVDNHCFTNCVYCYEDKLHKIEHYIKFERVKEIIEEASSIGMSTIDAMGGDIFMYQYWEQLIECLIKNQYKPYLSTKVPITSTIVSKLNKIGINRIQLSLDSIIPSELSKMLLVKDTYFDLVKRGIEILNEAGIEIIIRAVITCHNDSTTSIEKLVNFASSYKMVSKIDLIPAAYSQFTPYNYNSTLSKINTIAQNIPIWKERYQKNINISNWLPEYESTEKQKRFNERGECIANKSSLFMLPDGKVTICEQLYWHPFFIIGDLTNQSIMEVWNSKKAHELWNFSQRDIRPQSPCKTCRTFDNCRHGLGICWRDVVAYYGTDNYDYPPTLCPKAPIGNKKYFLPK